jgi:flagellar export protein FliJ
MKRYQFRLAAVLRLRVAEEEQAREALIAANARLKDLVRARDAEVARYGALRGEELSTTLDGLRAEQLRADLISLAITAANRAVGAAKTDAAVAQVVWTSAERRVRILERLDERRRAEHAADEARAEIVETDDIVTARYVAASQAGAGDALLGRAS